jgi:hypothetical protein
LKDNELSIEEKWKECLEMSNKIKLIKKRNNFIKICYNSCKILIKKELKILNEKKDKIDEIIFKNGVECL